MADALRALDDESLWQGIKKEMWLRAGGGEMLALVRRGDRVLVRFRDTQTRGPLGLVIDGDRDEREKVWVDYQDILLGYPKWTFAPIDTARRVLQFFIAEQRRAPFVTWVSVDESDIEIEEPS